MPGVLILDLVQSLLVHLVLLLLLALLQKHLVMQDSFLLALLWYLTVALRAG
jgi:hypothetical protein